MAVDREEAARDGGRVAFLRTVDLDIAGRRRRRGVRFLDRRDRFPRKIDLAMERDLPAVDAALPKRESGVFLHAIAKGSDNRGETGMAAQQEPRANVAVTAGHQYVRAPGIVSVPTKRPPGLLGVRGDAARNRRRDAFGE